jgi:hypothetical protein
MVQMERTIGKAGVAICPPKMPNLMNWKITLLKGLKQKQVQQQVEFNPNQPKDESPICVTSGALLLHLVWNFFGKKCGDNATFCAEGLC